MGEKSIWNSVKEAFHGIRKRDEVLSINPGPITAWHLEQPKPEAPAKPEAQTKLQGSIKPQRPSMPADWDDHDGWEQYYAALYPAGRFRETLVFSMQIAGLLTRQFSSIMLGLRERLEPNIWFPGCGFSPLPKVFAAFGFQVYATDVAPTALDFQQSEQNHVDGLIRRYQPPLQPCNSGKLHCDLQDFREPYHLAFFDAILNFRSLQCFSAETMRRVSKTHHDALKPGCVAYFDTMNVQGERRDLLEGSLIEAGFHIPLAAFNRNLRLALRDTGIPHNFILDRPMVPKMGVYADNDEKWNRDTATLQRILAEGRGKAQEAWEAEKQALTPSTKTAKVMYNTG